MKTINISLNEKSIKEAIKSLENYKSGLAQKCAMFVRMLAEVGITAAKANLGGYSGYILLHQELDRYPGGCTAVIIAEDSRKIISRWMRGSEIVTAEVSPILMAEFGSGFGAKVAFNIEGVGQGTFPGQTHAFDPGGWHWRDVTGKWHHSRGAKPTQPMLNAVNEMIAESDRIAKEVFGT